MRFLAETRVGPVEANVEAEEEDEEDAVWRESLERGGGGWRLTV